MVSGRLDRRWAAMALAACVYGLWLQAIPAAPAGDEKSASLEGAVCAIVYPVDQIPSARGYRYLFYGNGFFINEQGYLVTAAHVLSQIRGGQPYVLLEKAAGPPAFVRAALVAMDVDHDVAVLRATPNPFDGGYRVGFLPLDPAWAVRGSEVITASRHPIDPLHAYTLDEFVDEQAPGEVRDFQFSQLYKGRAETQLFLVHPQVRRGQSGSPVISGETKGVAGFVEGQWLRAGLVQVPSGEDGDSPGAGAAVPVHYVIALVEQKGIAWHQQAAMGKPAEAVEAGAGGYSPPTALSLVACPYPTQALFGGEVVLDALVDASGRVADTKTVRGDSPFLENALAAVRTWSFFPARQEGQPVAAHIGIAFQFVQSHEPLRARGGGRSGEGNGVPLAGSVERGALPVATVEPELAAAGAHDSRAILWVRVGAQGQLSTVDVIQDSESLAPVAAAAVRKWRFVAGKRGGIDSDSAAIVVYVYRYSGSAAPAR